MVIDSPPVNVVTDARVLASRADGLYMVILWITGITFFIELDYVIEAWHERYGTMTQNVTVTTGETTEITFEFNENMAGNVVPLADPLILQHDKGHAPVRVGDRP